MGGTAFIFPGQGSQYAGMGKRLFEAHKEIRELYASASGAAGFDVAALSFHGPQEKLDSDINAQVCVYVCNEACRIAAAHAGLYPQAVTGYSMGFYSAMAASGVVSFIDGLKIVMAAGNLAIKYGGPGAMGAVIGLGAEELEEICLAASSPGKGVWVSNVNAARQVLVSGSPDAVEAAVGLALEKGALSAYRLNMGAAYHSPMMEEASNKFKAELKKFSFNRPQVPLLSYIDAEYVVEGGGVRDVLGRHLASRVPWKDAVQRLARDGFTRFVEAGPGSALTRMVRWVDRGALAVPVEEFLKTKDVHA